MMQLNPVEALSVRLCFSDGGKEEKSDDKKGTCYVTFRSFSFKFHELKVLGLVCACRFVV